MVCHTLAQMNFGSDTITATEVWHVWGRGLSRGEGRLSVGGGGGQGCIFI